MFYWHGSISEFDYHHDKCCAALLLLCHHCQSCCPLVASSGSKGFHYEGCKQGQVVFHFFLWTKVGWPVFRGMNSDRNTLWLDRRRSPKLRAFFVLEALCFFLGWCLPWFWMNFNQLTEKVWTFCSCSSQCPGMRRKILKKTRINFGRGQMEFVFGEFSLATSPGRAQTFGQSKSLPLETGRTIRTIYGLFTLPISMDWDGKQTIGNNWKSKQRIDYFIFLDLMDNRMISIQ